jgi:hypothetical protein
LLPELLPELLEAPELLPELPEDPELLEAPELLPELLEDPELLEPLLVPSDPASSPRALLLEPVLLEPQAATSTQKHADRIQSLMESPHFSTATEEYSGLRLSWV